MLAVPHRGGYDHDHRISPMGDTTMRATTFASGTFTALLLAAAAHAGVTLNSARVAGKDAVALGKFYETAFGLKEVNRLTFPNGVEIFLNFGDNVDGAKANAAAQVVIMQSDPAAKDTIAHLIFNVTRRRRDRRRRQSRGRHDGPRADAVRQHRDSDRHRRRPGRQSDRADPASTALKRRR